MLPQSHIGPATSMGATLVPGGAVFKVWAPRANAVYLSGRFNGTSFSGQTGDRLMSKDPKGYWTGFQAAAADGDPYRFWVEGAGSSGFKRDPYARELSSEAAFPDCDNILRAGDTYPWHDAGFVTPDFSAMVIYQAHVGTFAISRPGISANFLDVCARIPHLVSLGINVLQPLPIDEQEVNPSMGYGGADLFSPDFPYVAAPEQLPTYLAAINALFAAKGLAPLALGDIASAPGQLKALVDLCHVHSIAVTFDVVYNHAGGFSTAAVPDDQCLYYFDRAVNVGDNNASLYFTNQDRGTGGLAFALWNEDVCAFLEGNATRYVREFHADGFRYDEISILLSTGQATGWAFCRALTTGLRSLAPRLLQNAEFWPGEFDDVPTSVAPVLETASSGGAGFDVVQHDALRGALRALVGAASAGAGPPLPVSAVASALYPPGLDHGWQAVTCIENHDLVMAGRNPRIPALADSSDARSWYARSRTRAAMGILLTAPGIPQLFMGQEILEPLPWNTDPAGPDLVNWSALEAPDGIAADHLHFTRDLVALRSSAPALRSDCVHAYYVSEADRVLAYHRWVEGLGEDIVVVASFAETTWWDYRLGFPSAGAWRELFNSDAYDNWPNPQVAGNCGSVDAAPDPLHGFTASTAIVIPANAVLVFARG